MTKIPHDVERKGLDYGFSLNDVAKAAEHKREIVLEALRDSKMVMCITGLGGMTGTGAIPVMVQVAKDVGALSVAVVTLPFAFESKQHKRRAEIGLEELKCIVDTVIVIPNDLVIRCRLSTTTIEMAFSLVDNTVFWAIKCIADVFTDPRLCLALEDLWPKRVPAAVAFGMGIGPNCLMDAMDQAMTNILSQEVTLKKSRRILMNLYIHPEQTMDEIDAVIQRLSAYIAEEADLCWGIDRECIQNPHETILALIVFGPPEEQQTSAGQ